MCTYVYIYIYTHIYTYVYTYSDTGGGSGAGGCIIDVMVSWRVGCKRASSPHVSSPGASLRSEKPTASFSAEIVSTKIFQGLSFFGAPSFGKM